MRRTLVGFLREPMTVETNKKIGFWNTIIFLPTPLFDSNKELVLSVSVLQNMDGGVFQARMENVRPSNEYTILKCFN